ncbi:TlpA disulfide reductase family protein [Neolewinella antarctica]|uniref:Thiol-disulfide isomerase/thioredoxin n=1 Tax=Neolewinella antarctica TaxID=442734 RepID=A0ABX0X8N5_9BACT|nr:TlpA disulfide reductase family protein [Neolewinella antarctica]NJC25304.1 thiol-disulfide isomerase/thioredoxin [Neolewinella antarctica]
MIRPLTILLMLCLLSACTFVQERYPSLPPGPYRGILELEYNPIVPNPKGAPIPEKTDLDLAEVTSGALPFTFDVIYETETTFRMEIHNGEETMVVPAKDIVTGRDQAAGRDTVRINFPVYDSYISAYHEENVLEGVWVTNYRSDYRIPFKAYFGKGYRFTPLRKEPAADLTGIWEVAFTDEDGTYPGIAEFTQDKNQLSGTFRTETGDYRYLEGTVQANKAYLSVFDGSHAFLFEATIGPDDALKGSFLAGRHYIANWTAKRNDQAKLADPDGITKMIDPVPLNFSFPDADGNTVSLSDPAYAGRPKLIKIMGTWCPNCRDEAEFIKDYLAITETQDLAVIALAFEQYGADDDRSRAAIKRYLDNTGVTWPVLLAGSSDKEEAGEALPMLDKIISFPTLLFVDRNNMVQRIHTGFNGPATSQYEAFSRSFDQSVKDLLKNPSK